MKREAQSEISEDGQLSLDQYRQVLQQLEDLSPITVRNYLSDLRQFIAWCECSWHEERERLITLWADININASTKWEVEIDHHLNTVVGRFLKGNAFRPARKALSLVERKEGNTDSTPNN